MSGNNYNATNQNYGYDPNFSPVPPSSSQGGQYSQNPNSTYPNYSSDYNLNNQTNNQANNQANGQTNNQLNNHPILWVDQIPKSET